MFFDSLAIRCVIINHCFSFPMVLVPWSCLHSKFTLSTHELSTFLLNVISNKSVAKIYTDLQVFTIYQRGICNFDTFKKPWLLNHARSVITLNQNQTHNLL